MCVLCVANESEAASRVGVVDHKIRGMMMMIITRESVGSVGGGG